MSEYVLPISMTLFPYTGGLLTYNIPRKNAQWYKTLKKPAFLAPKIVFAPVWGILYGCMGYASYCVLRDAPSDKALVPLALYSTHLMFNWSWTPIFFGAHKINLVSCVIYIILQSVVDIVLTTALACATTLSFKSVSTTAYNLMIPYVLWMFYASAVNIGTAILNK